ncbi:MAG: methylmalonyl-CoA carboxyltransferase [Alphaproteobacteria bacterium]|nr:methylmalonyl-CoA carboxyltransferase [Alphaproteobacteria bacterium]
MGWQSHIDELRARERLAEQMGGEERVARQKSQGKLTVRERIAFLADPGSFHEVGKISGKASYGPDDTIAEFLPATMVFGRARLEGRPVVILGDDFTVRGGASDASIAGKMLMAEQMAHEYGLPIIRMVDGTGGGGSVKSLESNPRTYIPTTPAWEWVVANMARTPVVSLALGPCAGLGAGRVAASHYSVMVRGMSQVFVAGPPVARAIGETVDKEGLGGWEIQARNGTVDDVVDTEADAFARARRFLSYLPSNVEEIAPRQTCGDPADRREAFLIDIVPTDGKTPYKPRRIIEAVFDRDSFFETGELWGRSVVTGFARLDGYAVAVIAGDPFFLDGAWTADACEKVVRLVDLAETFHLPIVHLVDCPGFAVGARHEKAGVTRKGVRAMAAVYQASVPICPIIIRKAYGLAGSAMFNPSRTRWRYCWPSGDWGSLPMAGGIEAAYKRQLEASPDPQAELADLYRKFEAMRSPFRTAEAFIAEEIIDPRHTRPLLCEFAMHAYRVLKTGPRSFGMRP